MLIIQGYFAVAVIIVLVTLISSRVILLRKKGVKAVKLGEMDKKDFLIVPFFVLLYFYIICASAFNWPLIGTELFRHEFVGWIGAGLCLLGLLLFLTSLIVFGRSYRIGIDEEHPGPLVTAGPFAITRNPLYIALGLILTGIFLIFTNWVLLLYLLGGLWLISRQVLLEEASLKKIYGQAYDDYCQKVPRYF